tara:strand:+ start:605 stop:994 length:390 start_codon:yes stop_codon:yes gene_type:complete
MFKHQKIDEKKNSNSIQNEKNLSVESSSYVSQETEKYLKDKNQKNQTKLYVGIGILLIVIISSVFLVQSKPDICSCKKSIYNGNDELYSRCIKMYFDEAFDWAELMRPNTRYSNQEAVIQSYWIEKCDY